MSNIADTDDDKKINDFLDDFLTNNVYDNKSGKFVSQKQTVSTDMKIIGLSFAYLDPEVAVQHVNDSRCILASENGHPAVLVRIFNGAYTDMHKYFHYELIVRVYYKGIKLEEIHVNDTVSEPDLAIIEKWVDLKNCANAGSYRIEILDKGGYLLSSDEFHVTVLPQPYASQITANNLILHRVDKGCEPDYSDLGPVCATFDSESLGLVILGAAFDSMIKQNEDGTERKLALSADVYNEHEYLVWHESQIVETSDMDGSRILTAIFEIGRNPELKWNKGTYHADIRFFDEVVATCVFHVASKDVEYQFTKTEIRPRRSTVGKKHLSADYTLDSMTQLNSLIGLENVKRKIDEYRSVVLLSKKRSEMGLPAVKPVLHAAFMGNPGTGKTTVAKILGSMMKELGLLSKGHVVVEERSTLMGQNYASEQEKTLSALERAKGGILFIDEAYLLHKPDDPRDPGMNVIETLLTALADPEQQDWMLLIAGYTEPMNQMLEHNAGLRSRIPEQNRFVFDDYTIDELMQIAELFCRQNNYELSDEAREKIRRRVEKEYSQKDNKFGNARFVNNLFKIEVIPAFSRRVNALESVDATDLTLIKGEDVSDMMHVDKFDDRFDFAGIERALEKLDSMVAMEHVKSIIHNTVDAALWMRNEGRSYFGKKNLKWIFAGNTGTGKSTVASILGDLLKAMNVLERGHLVELKGEEIMGMPEYKMDELIKEAVTKAAEGVLFLDGDYTSDAAVNEFSAIQLKIEGKIADLHGKCALVIGVCKDSLGILERLMLPADSPYHLMFEDYSADELVQILCKILEHNSLVMSEEAMTYMKEYVSDMKNANTYGLASARTMKYIANLIHDKYLFRISRTKENPAGTIILQDVDEFVWREVSRRPIGF